MPQYDTGADVTIDAFDLSMFRKLSKEEIEDFETSIAEKSKEKISEE